MAVDKVGGAILFLDPESLAVLTSIAIPGAHEMAISADHRFGYVAQFGKWGRNAAGIGTLTDPGTLIWVLDLHSRAVIGRIDRPRDAVARRERVRERGLVRGPVPEVGDADRESDRVARVDGLGLSEAAVLGFECTGKTAIPP